MSGSSETWQAGCDMSCVPGSQLCGSAEGITPRSRRTRNRVASRSFARRVTRMFCRSDGARLMTLHLLDEWISTEQCEVDTRSRWVREGRLSDGDADKLRHVH